MKPILWSGVETERDNGAVGAPLAPGPLGWQVAGGGRADVYGVLSGENIVAISRRRMKRGVRAPARTSIWFARPTTRTTRPWSYAVSAVRATSSGEAWGRSLPARPGTPDSAYSPVLVKPGHTVTMRT